MVFWCVTTKCYDNGTVEVSLDRIEAGERPDNEMLEGEEYDEYKDYFDGYEEAKKFYEDSKRA